AFVEGLADRARSFARRRHFKAEWDPERALVDGLLIGARALGIEAANDQSSHASLVRALFEPPPAKEGEESPRSDDGSEWIQFTEALRQCRGSGAGDSHGQPTWQDHLLDLVGARQGQADNVHAIDVTRLTAAIEATCESWEFREVLPSAAGVAPLA